MISCPTMCVPSQQPDVNDDESSTSEDRKDITEQLIVIRIHITVPPHYHYNYKQNQGASTKEEIKMTIPH